MTRRSQLDVNAGWSRDRATSSRCLDRGR